MLDTDPMLSLGFIKQQERVKFDVFKDLQPHKKAARPDTNLWDISNFSSIDNKLPIYPRKKGFVDFDLQTIRPEM